MFSTAMYIIGVWLIIVAVCSSVLLVGWGLLCMLFPKAKPEPPPSAEQAAWLTKRRELYRGLRGSKV